MKANREQDYFVKKIIEIEKRINVLDVELKSFLKNVTITKWFVVAILALLGFFGFREISQIRATVVSSIKPQIAYVDSLVATVEISKIDSLSLLIKKREEEQKILLQKLTALISTTKEVERKHIQIMLPNEVLKTATKYPHTAESDHNLFEIVQPESKYFKVGNTKRTIVIKLLISADSVHHVLVQLFKEGHTLKGEYSYAPKEGYNKLEFTSLLEVPNYLLVGIFLKKNWESELPCYYSKRLDVK